MDPKTLVLDKLNLLVPVGTLLVGALVILPLVSPGNGAKEFPLVGAELGSFQARRKYFLRNALQLHADAYKKFRHQACRMTQNEGDVIILPISYLEELRKLPDSIIDNVEALNEVVQTKHLGLSSDNPLMAHIIRSDLTHNLPSVNTHLCSAVATTVPEYLGTSREWTPITINPKLMQMVAVISGHIFIGPELNHSQTYLDSSINYTVDLFGAATELRQWPSFMRSIVKYFIPSVDRLNEHRRKAREFLVPVIRERRALRQAGRPEPNDVLQWTIAKADKFNVTDDGDIAEIQLTLSLAAIHTTTMTATHVLYDIIGHCPEVIPELRAEIRRTMADHNNVMTTQALYQMKLLDSVMRESQRMNVTIPVRFVRRVKADITLSDGTRLPAGSTIQVPSSEPKLDASYYSEPHRFNPYRFYDIRAGKVQDPLNFKNKEQYQFISVNKENTSFGYGRHACPGRFFAANEIKLILARILLDYDIKMPDGQHGRFPNLFNGTSVNPDPTRQVMFKYVANA